jgi:hypothetical protein
LSPECPLWVISGHVGLREQESALPLKQTCHAAAKRVRYVPSTDIDATNYAPDYCASCIDPRPGYFGRTVTVPSAEIATHRCLIFGQLTPNREVAAKLEPLPDRELRVRRGLARGLSR